MGTKKEGDPLSAFSGSVGTFKPPRWTRGIRREFELGDLVTLAPEFRYSITMTTGPDMGRYIGIITQTYANREYMVVWTSHPMQIANKHGLFNGDHLIKVENADKALLGPK
tara:strand:+ start:221 stop:553 length:333 start_codon:yes stop_codon:yes gene_type:complete